MSDNQHFIECDGSGVPWSACFKEAAKVCPSGYDLISQNTDHGPYTGAATNDSAVLGAVERKNITVKCR